MAGFDPALIEIAQSESLEAHARLRAAEAAQALAAQETRDTLAALDESRVQAAQALAAQETRDTLAALDESRVQAAQALAAQETRDTLAALDDSLLRLPGGSSSPILIEDSPPDGRGDLALACSKAPDRARAGKAALGRFPPSPFGGLMMRGNGKNQSKVLQQALSAKSGGQSGTRAKRAQLATLGTLAPLHRHVQDSRTANAAGARSELLQERGRPDARAVGGMHASGAAVVDAASGDTSALRAQCAQAATDRAKKYLRGGWGHGGAW